eukprot:GILI01009950.1.p1 GENE.GILI01009950.1~~GILI01009950.1.p1  ORF type:complete len:112 (+),score=6.38 GILI01009950.1:118-453(+)
MINKHCCAVCCSGFSAFAVVFLIFLGSTLLSSSAWVIEMPEKHREHSATSCFISAIVYAVFGLSSVAYIYKNRLEKQGFINSRLSRGYVELGPGDPQQGPSERSPLLHKNQ